MSLTLLIIFALINILMIASGLKSKMGVFQFPCLIGCVNLAFAFPQLYSIYNVHRNADSYMALAFLFMCLCCAALWAGFYWGNNHLKQTNYIVRFNPDALIKVIVVFFIIGITAYFTNRGVQKGGRASGTYVIIRFFQEYANYALFLILIILNRHIKYTKLLTVLLIGEFIIGLDFLFLAARRGNAIVMGLAVLYFYLNKLSPTKYKSRRWMIPIFFFIGMILSTNIADYRSNAYKGTMSATENFESLDYSNTASKIFNNAYGELNNAILGINYAYAHNAYDYGATNWNGLVATLVPKVIVGTQAKNAMYLPIPTQEFANTLTADGSTMTGYFDSFGSFGIFGFIKFFIIGLIMGILWHRRQSSDLSLFLYLLLLTPGLHLITHQSAYFFYNLALYALFIYPFIRPCRVKWIPK